MRISLLPSGARRARGKFFQLFREFDSRHIAHLVVPRRFDLFARQAFRAAEIAPRYDRVCEIGAGDVARLKTRGRKILRRKIAARQIAFERYAAEIVVTIALCRIENRVRYSGVRRRVA